MLIKLKSFFMTIIKIPMNVWYFIKSFFKRHKTYRKMFCDYKLGNIWNSIMISIAYIPVSINKAWTDLRIHIESEEYANA